MEVYSVPLYAAAKIMGKGTTFICEGLKQGKLPIGVAFKISGDSFNYYISPKLLMEFTGCTEKDIKEAKRGSE